MLDLNARVHLDEKEFTVFVKELERARAAVVDFPARFGTTLADAHDVPASNTRCRRLLDDFLVATLHRAIALAKVDGIPEAVGKHLNLDVPRVLEVLLQVDVWIAEKALCLRTRHRHAIDQRRFGMDDAHPASAAAAGRLDDHRVADRLGNTQDLHRIVGQRTVGTGNAGDAGDAHSLLGGHLVAHQTDGFGTRTDEHKAGRLDTLGEIRVLGKKAIARMNGLRIGDLGRRDDCRNVQVALRGGRRTNAHRFVGKSDVLGLAVRLRVHDDGLDTQLAARSLNTQGDFSTVGDEDFPEHGR